MSRDAAIASIREGWRLHSEDGHEDAKRCDLQAFGAWCRGLLARGVYPPPAQFEAWFPSLAHTSEHVDRTLEAAAAAFAELDA